MRRRTDPLEVTLEGIHFSSQLYDNMIDIRVPQVFAPIVKSVGEDFVVIEHPPTPCRISDTMVALALAKAFEDQEVVLISGEQDEVERAQLLVSSWLQGSKITRAVRYSGSLSFRFPGRAGELIISKSLTKVVHFQVDWLITLSADRVEHDPRDVISAKKVTFVGNLTRHGHWLYDLRHLGELIQISHESLVETFPDLASRGLAVTDPMYPRLMLLQDVMPKSEISPFRVFARSRVRIRTDKPRTMLSAEQQLAASQQHGTPIVPFTTTKLQRRYLAMKRRVVAQGKKPWFILLKYRRGGFTTLEQAASFQMCVERPNSQVVTLADTAAKASRIFGMVDIMHQHDPKRIGLLGDSKTQIEFTNGSKFFIGTAGSKGFARGDTLQRGHWSEAAFSCQGPNQTQLVTDVKAGLIGAASNGELVFESTPNRRNWFYNDYMEAREGRNEFSALFVRWFDDPMNIAREGTYDPQEIIETLLPDERELVDRHSLTLPQLAFRRANKSTFKALFPQEFPEDDESCFLSSGLCMFNVDRLVQLTKSSPPPIKVETKVGGTLSIWEQPIPGREYVIGADTSEGLGPPCDLSGGVVLDKKSGTEVALLHGRFSPRTLAEELVKLSKKYNHALLGIERENHGHAVLSAVRDLGYLVPHWRGGHVYFFQEPTDDSFKSQMPVEGRAGWATNGQTRPVMLSDLAEAFDKGHLQTRSRAFLSECSTFSLQHSGRWEADPGCHDDVVIMMAIAWQMRNVIRRMPGIMT